MNGAQTQLSVKCRDRNTPRSEAGWGVSRRQRNNSTLIFAVKNCTGEPVSRRHRDSSILIVFVKSCNKFSLSIKSFVQGKELGIAP